MTLPPTDNRPGVEARLVASEVVLRVLDEGAYVQHALGAELERSTLDARDRAFATELTYGTLTWLRPIDLALSRLLSQGLDATDPMLVALLRVGAYQLQWHDDLPAFAVVHEMVEATRRARGRRKAGFVNAVLRGMQRDQHNVFQPPKKATGAARIGVDHSVPDWIAELLVDRVGTDEAAAAMAAWNRPTSVVVRWRSSEPPDATLLAPTDGSPSLAAHPVVPRAWIVDGPVSALAALSDGRATVQDAGAQLAAACLPDDLAGPIWDACAGVGGKSRHLADRFGADRVLATDNAEAKLRRLAEEIPGARTETWSPDAGALPVLVSGGDAPGAVLVDAPCSGLGSIGRHPDTRWNRGPEVVAELANVQAALLDAAAAAVPPGGWLVYMVCTWTRAEGPDQVQRFLERHPSFKVAAPTDEAGVPWGDLVDATGCVSVWPHRHQTDGFHLARLRRANA